jgi:hypothetical protein
LILKFVPNANWLAVMIGFVVGLKAQIFALWFNGDRTDRVIKEAQVKQQALLEAEAKLQADLQAATVAQVVDVQVK